MVTPHLSSATLWYVGAGVGAVLLYLVWRVVSLVKEGRMMQVSGHLAPPPRFPARLFWWVATPIISFIGVGPVKVIGRENLRKARGRRIYAANHHFELDFNMVAKAARDRFRSMTACSQLKGLTGIFSAWTGSAIPVDTKVKNGGEAALNASIEYMVRTRAARFLIFPQGKLLSQDKIERSDFRTGAVRLAQGVYEQTGKEPTYIVPMGMYYLRDKSQASFSQWFFGWTRRVFKVQNYGAVVVIGEPIDAASLPEDVNKATDMLYESIQRLLAQATTVAHSSGTSV